MGFKFNLYFLVRFAKYCMNNLILICVFTMFRKLSGTWSWIYLANAETHVTIP